MNESDIKILELMEKNSIDFVYGIYAESLLARIGVNVDKLNEEAKQGIISKMKDRIYDILSRLMLDEIPPKKAKEIQKKKKRGEDTNQLIVATLLEQSVDIKKLALKAMFIFGKTFLEASE